MKFIISQLKFHNDDSKKEGYKINLFAILKLCLYLILIDHFLISVDVYCAESSDFFVIEKESIGLTFKDQAEELNDIVDKLEVGSQGRKDSKSGDEKCKLNDKEVPITADTDNSTSTFFLLELKIFKLEYNLFSMHDCVIQAVINDHCEVKDLQKKAIDLIKKIKSSVKSYDEKFIEKIEERMKAKKGYDSKINDLIEKVRKGTKDLLMSFESLKNQFYETITSQNIPILRFYSDFAELQFTEIDNQLKDLFKGLLVFKISFNREKCKTKSILIILKKALELTPEEFKRDEQVSKTLLSFN